MSTSSFSIVLRFTQNKFKEAQGPTIGAAFSAKKLHVRGKEITLRVWDTAGMGGCGGWGSQSWWVAANSDWGCLNSALPQGKKSSVQ